MFFYEKNCPKHRPEWVKTARVWSEGNNRWMDYCVFEDLPTLVWAANLADIELHTSLSLGKEIMRPTFLVFDLDPGPPANIVQCCQVGIWVRDIFAKLGLKSFAKTSGSKGLQIYVPLNTAVTYDDTKPFAHEVARLLERQYPQQVVSDMKKTLRTGKVFIDWSQNDDHKTTICVYSLRAKERPTASPPVNWEEQNCLRRATRVCWSSRRMRWSSGPEIRGSLRAGAEAETEAAAAQSTRRNAGGRKRRDSNSRKTHSTNGIDRPSSAKTKKRSTKKASRKSVAYQGTSLLVKQRPLSSSRRLQPRHNPLQASGC